MKETLLATLRTVAAMSRQLGYSPSIMEIAADRGMSGMAIRKHLTALTELGMLEPRARNKARALVLTPAGKREAKTT